MRLNFASKSSVPPVDCQTYAGSGYPSYQTLPNSVRERDLGVRVVERPSCASRPARVERRGRRRPSGRRRRRAARRRPARQRRAASGPTCRSGRGAPPAASRGHEALVAPGGGEAAHGRRRAARTRWMRVRRRSPPSGGGTTCQVDTPPASSPTTSVRSPIRKPQHGDRRRDRPTRRPSRRARGLTGRGGRTGRPGRARCRGRGPRRARRARSAVISPSTASASVCTRLLPAAAPDRAPSSRRRVCTHELASGRPAPRSAGPLRSSATARRERPGAAAPGRAADGVAERRASASATRAPSVNVDVEPHRRAGRRGRRECRRR